jgi:acetylornithine deacetylase/succinyl-diaminopimelate desuccinylase-like protein
MMTFVAGASAEQRGASVDIAGIDPAVVEEVERETSELLSALIQIDTSNPPGDETRVAEFMAAWFAGRGVTGGQIVGEPEDRRSFVLRLESGRPGPSLLLLAHEDVVPADAADWQVPPFSGLIKDGYVWGRGAVDIKNLVAAHAVAAARIALSGGPAAGTLVYACTADEEEGSVGGARWLCANRPDLIRTDYVINEGGGHFLERAGRRVYLIESGEKGTAQFRLVVKGQAGHASVPLRNGNAVVAAARVIDALATHELPLVIDGSSEELVSLLVDSPALRERLRDPRTARKALQDLARRDVQLADMIEPLYGFQFSPTILKSNSVAVNVFPTRVEVSVDCRMLAGHDEQEVLTEVRTALDGVEADWDLEWVGPVTRGNSSPYPSPLSDAIRSTLQRFVPEAQLANSHSVGFTDSNWFRAAFPDTVAYNFAPHLVEGYEAVTPRYHNVDERILVRDVAFQALFAESVAREVLTP